MKKQELARMINEAAERSSVATDKGLQASVRNGKIIYTDRYAYTGNERKITFFEALGYLHGADARTIRAACGRQL